MTKNILTILGARPQFVKAAIVSKMILKEKINELIVHTGQHYDSNMSGIFFDELELPKINHHLAVGSGSHGKQTGEMIIQIEKVLFNEKPDLILIYGDTNSTLAGAIAGSKLNIPIAHVEAGLRSFNRRMPEEINRIIADQLSEMLFTPTEAAVKNLINEGYSQSRIFEVGDVMYDASIFYGEKAEKISHILAMLRLLPKSYVLSTIHRAENTDNLQKLNNILCVLENLCEEINVILPLHPRTKKIIHSHFPDFLSKTKVKVIEPLGFLDMLMLEKNAKLIVTDSGGIQKEAFFYQVPCITLREETEWLESINLGWNRLINPTTDSGMIHQQLKDAFYQKGKLGQQPYGNGNASQLIVEHIMQH